MAEHNQLGIQGEQLAQQFLYNQGYELLAFNWRLQHVEIDIIAKHQNTLVFVEVKTRSSSQFGSPFEALTQKKQDRLMEAASAYLNQLDEEVEWRFDAIAVLIEDSQTKIEHLVDAFRPEF